MFALEKEDLDSVKAALIPCYELPLKRKSWIMFGPP